MANIINRGSAGHRRVAVRAQQRQRDVITLQTPINWSIVQIANVA